MKKQKSCFRTGLRAGYGYYWLDGNVMLQDGYWMTFKNWYFGAPPVPHDAPAGGTFTPQINKRTVIPPA